MSPRLKFTVGAVALFSFLLAWWFYSRVDAVAFGSTQGFPYPDALIAKWERVLDTAHPVEPDSLKIEGEFPRIELYLEIAMAVFGLVAAAAAVASLLNKHQK